jgi:membrane protease YdiL (CAAX protease family)
MGTGGKIWWILYPVVIYLGCQLLIGIILGIAGAAIAMGDLAPLAISDPAAFTEQYTAALMEFIQKATVPMSWVLTIVCLAIFIPLFFRDIKKFSLRPDKIVKSSALTWIAIPFAVLGWYFLFVVIAEMLKLIELFPDMTSNNALFEAQHPVLAFILVAVLTPIFEELFFRGLVFKRLRGVMGFIPSALISALFFGIMHLTPPQIIYASAFGIFFAYIYEKKGSLLPSIFAHICVNACAALFGYLASESLYNAIISPITIVVAAVICAAGVVVTIISVKKIPAYVPPVIEMPAVEVPVAETPAYQPPQE